MNMKSPRTRASVALMCFLLTSAAHAQSIQNAIPDVARPLPVSAVRVTGGPLKRAQDLNAEYLLKLEPNRMMAYYPKRAGLEPKAQFIDRVLWGGLQYKEGPNKYGVRKSLFYYSPPDVPAFKYDPALNWTTWTSWKKADAESIGRGYNYPHVIAAYWSMYRLARNHPGLVTNHSWDWYLDQAYETARFMFSRQANGRRRVGYVELGLMEGDVIVALLDDLKREAWQEKAQVVENLMQERTNRWRQDAYPFGSEMAWDSTGQQEVYAWCKYFGHDDKALVSLNSIIGYMPTLPHWGYNGNARRYWDFLYGGKLRRIERQLHHYGSGLNAIPVLAALSRKSG